MAKNSKHSSWKLFNVFNRGQGRVAIGKEGQERAGVPVGKRKSQAGGSLRVENIATLCDFLQQNWKKEVQEKGGPLPCLPSPLPKSGGLRRLKFGLASSPSVYFNPSFFRVRRLCSIIVNNFIFCQNQKMMSSTSSIKYFILNSLLLKTSSRK